MISAKTKARQCAVQALYQWQITQQNLNVIDRQFQQDQRLKNAQKSYFADLFYGVFKHLDAIDISMVDFIDREIEKIDPVERAILRISVYELLHKPNTPYRVIINEGIELAKLFGADGSYRYINGVLNKVAQTHRKLEIEVPFKQN